MGKDDNFKISIPKLKKETNYAEWKETLFSVLGTKQLQHYLTYEVQKPTLVNLEQTAYTLTNPTLTLMVPGPELLNVLRRLPRKLVNQINNGDEFQLYLEDSENLPDMLVDLAINAEFILILNNKLYSVFTDRDDYRTARTSHVKSVEKVRSVVRSSIAYENVHLFKNANVYMAFQTVSKQFEKDLRLERESVKRRLGKLKCKNLKHYVNDFRKLLVELDHAGGDRNAEEVVSIFLNNIPNSKFLTYKTLFKGTTIEEAFEWFKDIGDKQENLREAEANNAYRDPARVRKVMTTVTSQPTQVVQVKKVTIAKRCLKCGGFGHLVKDCPNAVAVCHRCGSPDHFKRDCKVRKIFVEPVSSQDVGDLESECESIESLVVDESEMDDNDCLGFTDVQVQAVFVRKLNTKRQCHCRFQKDCLQIVLDSGASQSITGDRSILTNLRTHSTVTVTNAFGQDSIAKQQGTLRCMLSNNVLLEIPNVLFCDSVEGTLLSVQHLVTQGFEVRITNSGARLSKQGRSIISTKYNNGSYTLHSTTNFREKQMIKAYRVTTADIQHARFGHASAPYLHRLGFKISPLSFCVACGSSKLVRKKTGKKINPYTTSTFVAQKPLQKIHVDTVGPLRRSLEGHRYFLTVVDSYTRFVKVIPTKSKDRIPRLLIALLQQWQNVFGNQIKCLFSDNGTEFLNSQIKSYLEKCGIRHECSNAHQPSENGRVERHNRIISDCARTMLAAAALPLHFWHCAVVHPPTSGTSFLVKVIGTHPSNVFWGILLI